VFVSNIDRGNRKPFSNDRILKIAGCLNVDATPLMKAAAASVDLSSTTSKSAAVYLWPLRVPVSPLLIAVVALQILRML
jgi:hypothetical protein